MQVRTLQKGARGRIYFACESKCRLELIEKLKKLKQGSTPRRREANALHLANLGLSNYGFQNLLKHRKAKGK